MALAGHIGTGALKDMRNFRDYWQLSILYSIIFLGTILTTLWIVELDIERYVIREVSTLWGTL